MGFEKNFFYANGLSRADREKLMKIKVIAMRAECSYLGDEQIHKKHELEILMTSAAKELTVKIKPP